MSGWPTAAFKSLPIERQQSFYRMQFATGYKQAVEAFMSQSQTHEDVKRTSTRWLPRNMLIKDGFEPEVIDCLPQQQDQLLGALYGLTLEVSETADISSSSIKDVTSFSPTSLTTTPPQL